MSRGYSSRRGFVALLFSSRAVSLTAVCTLAIFCNLGAIAAEPVAARAIPLEQARQLGVTLQTPIEGQPAVLAGLIAEVAVPADRLHLVGAPIAALVEQVLVSAGDRVLRGQPLARLNSPELVANRRSLLQAHAQAQLAQANLSRDSKLFAEGIIPARRLAETQATELAAQAALLESRQVLRLAGVDEAAIQTMLAGKLDEPAVMVKAPVDGIVLAREIELGQRIAASTPMFRLAAGDRLLLLIRVPRDRIAVVRPGARVLVSGQTLATVQAIGASVDPANQTVLVRAQVDDNMTALRIGEIVQVGVQIVPGDGESGITVPNRALVTSGGAHYLFVETPDGLRAERVKLLHAGQERSVVAGRIDAHSRFAVTAVAALKAALLGAGVQ